MHLTKHGSGSRYDACSCDFSCLCRNRDRSGLRFKRRRVSIDQRLKPFDQHDYLGDHVAMGLALAAMMGHWWHVCHEQEIAGVDLGNLGDLVSHLAFQRVALCAPIDYPLLRSRNVISKRLHFIEHIQQAAKPFSIEFKPLEIGDLPLEFVKYASRCCCPAYREVNHNKGCNCASDSDCGFKRIVARHIDPATPVRFVSEASGE